MVRRRHSLKAFVAALLAVVAVMIVTTTATATSAAATDPTMSMMPQAPCEEMQNGTKVPCTPHCAVLCQALISVPPDTVQRTPVWSPTRYEVSASALDGIAHEADDPPPRTPVR